VFGGKDIATKREYFILKRLLTVGFLTVFALVAWADTPALTRDVIRSLAYDGDHATLEMRLAVERDKSLEGNKDFSGLRELMYVFEASDPRMVSLIETWVNAEPASSFARADMLGYLCQTYAPLISDEGGDMTFRCLYAGLTRFYSSESYEARKRMQDEVKKDPEFDLSRAISMTSRQDSHNRTDADIEFARQTILEQAWWRQPIVQRFDSAFRNRLDGRSLADEIAILKYEEAKEALMHDPFNASMMNLVENWIRLQSNYGSSGMSEVELSKFRTRVEKDFALRRLLAAPFSENNWNTMGRLQFDYFRPESLFDSDPYYQNGVVYSGDEDRAWYGYLGQKIHQMSMLEEVLRQVDHPEILPWKEFAASLDQSALLHCPFLRAYLLLAAVCRDREGKGYCNEEDLASFAPHLNVVQADKNCSYLNGLTPEALAFKPVEIDLSYDPQKHWPAVE
jgi:hypothetical protein